ncbi:MAG: DNA repair protein RecO [Clostridia bacterium]|nr:DNA repair protein RecO [Clostridia bacterium]
MKKTVDGLVLREYPVGENDKLLTVLTAEQGRITMTAKGARSMKSRVVAMCHLFTYANFEYYEKGDRRWVSGGSVNQSFFEMNSDMEGFALAAYLSQIAQEITGEGVEAGDVLRMTLNALYCIAKRQKPLWQIKATYELFAAVISGFAPNLEGCADCGEGVPDVPWLDVMNGRIVCDSCLKKKTGNLPLPELDAYSARNILLPLDASALASMRYVCTAPLPRIFAYSLTDESSR